MWVGLDRLGHLLIDATLATSVFLTLAVLWMLSCHQPARRIMIAQAAIFLSILMIPLVATSPLPRLNPFAVLLPRGTPAAGWDAISSPIPHTPRPITASPPTWSTGPCPLRTLTLLFVPAASIVLAWLGIAFWGIRRLVRDSPEATPATR